MKEEKKKKKKKGKEENKKFEFLGISGSIYTWEFFATTKHLQPNLHTFYIITIIIAQPQKCSYRK